MDDLLSQNFVHFEHVDLVNPKDCPKTGITEDLPSIFGILQLVSFDVNPELFNHLWSRKLINLKNGR